MLNFSIRNNMKRLHLLLWAFIIPLVMLAQSETTLPELTRLHQASYINPAILPSYSTSIGTPVLSGVGVALHLNGINASTVISSMDTGYINTKRLYSKLNDKNIDISSCVNYEIFHFRFKSKNWYYGIHLNNRVINEMGISKEFIGFAANGNDFFAGKTFDPSSTKITILAFNELGFSMARNFNRLNVGYRAKLLQGIGAAQLTDFQLKWQQPQTSTGEIIITSSGTLNTASAPFLSDTLNGKKHTSDFNQKNLYSFKNLGMGIDLGATYDISNKFTVGASLVDFGWIKWNNETYNYSSNNTTIKFSGMDQNTATTDSLTSPYFDSIVKLVLPSNSDKSFTTFLPWRMFLTMSYKINQKSRATFMFQTRYINSAIIPAYTLAYTRKLGKNFDFTTNYSIIGKSYANVGLGFAAKTGAFQWYVVQDNLMAYFKPSTAQVVTLRLGVNLVWGEIKRPLKVY